MKKIILTKGKYALVDDEDFEKVNSYKWSYSNGFAISKINKKMVLMHRFIIQPFSNYKVNHINDDCLDNRKSNLRELTASQNQWNVKLSKNSKTGYKGVHFYGNRYRVLITHKNIKYHVGIFDTLTDAILAYNRKAESLFGEFARLNESLGGATITL